MAEGRREGEAPGHGQLGIGHVLLFSLCYVIVLLAKILLFWSFLCWVII